MPDTLLEVKQLTKYFPVKRTALFGERRRTVKAVDDISFTIQRGETVGLVGESGFWEVHYGAPDFASPRTHYWRNLFRRPGYSSWRRLPCAPCGATCRWSFKTPFRP